MSAIDLFLFLVTGMVAGTLAGLMGIGGGIVYVPVLVWYLERLGASPAVVPMVAVTSSLAIIVASAPQAAWGHWKTNNVHAGLLPPLLLGGAMAAWGASWVLAHLSAGPFKIYLGVFQLFIAWRLLASPQAQPDNPSGPPSRWLLLAIGLAAGFVAAFFGVGGGLVLVPLLHLAAKVPLRPSVGTTSVFIVGSTAVALAANMAHTAFMPGLPPQTWGGLYLPAVLAILSTAMVFNRLGAALIHHVPVLLLKRMMAAMVLGISLMSLWRASL